MRPCDFPLPQKEREPDPLRPNVATGSCVCVCVCVRPSVLPANNKERLGDSGGWRRFALQISRVCSYED